MSASLNGPPLPSGRLRISVALCTFNGASYLGEQLASLARQTRLPDELVVLDDASSDETVEIVRNFARAAPFPVSLQVAEENRGWVRGFFDAIDRCTGDLIAPCDQDDVWLEHKLERCEEWFGRHGNLALLVHSAQVVDAGLRPTGVRVPAFRHSALLSPSDVPLWFLHQGTTDGSFPGHALVFPSWLRRVAGARLLPTGLGLGTEVGPHMAHDYWACLLAPATGPIAVLAEDLLLNRRHGENASRQYLARRPTLRQGREPAAPGSVRFVRPRVGGSTGIRGLLDLSTKVERYQRVGRAIGECAEYLEDGARFQEHMARPAVAESMRRRARLLLRASAAYGRRAQAFAGTNGPARRWQRFLALVLTGGYGRRSRGGLGVASLAVDLVMALLGPSGCARASRAAARRAGGGRAGQAAQAANT